MGEDFRGFVPYDGYNVAWNDDSGKELKRTPLSVSANPDITVYLAKEVDFQALKRIEWTDLSEGTQLIIMVEFCRHADFGSVSVFLELSDDDLAAFIALTEREYKRYLDEDERIRVCVMKQCQLLQNIQYSQEEWDAANDEMFNGDSPTYFTFSREQIDNGKRFLQNFRYREEFPALNPEITPLHLFESYDEVLPYKSWKRVINVLDRYRGTITRITDLDFQRGVFNVYYEAQLEFLKELYPSMYQKRGVTAQEKGGESQETNPKCNQRPTLPLAATDEEFLRPLQNISKELGPISAPNAPQVNLPATRKLKKGNKPKTVPPSGYVLPLGHKMARPDHKVPPPAIMQLPPPHPQKVVSGPSSQRENPKSSQNQKKMMRAPSRLREVINIDDIGTLDSTRQASSVAMAHPIAKAVSRDRTSTSSDKKKQSITTQVRSPLSAGRDLSSASEQARQSSTTMHAPSPRKISSQIPTSGPTPPSNSKFRCFRWPHTS